MFSFISSCTYINANLSLVLIFRTSYFQQTLLHNSMCGRPPFGPHRDLPGAMKTMTGAAPKRVARLGARSTRLHVKTTDGEKAAEVEMNSYSTFHPANIFSCLQLVHPLDKHEIAWKRSAGQGRSGEISKIPITKSATYSSSCIALLMRCPQ